MTAVVFDDRGVGKNQVLDQHPVGNPTIWEGIGTVEYKVSSARALGHHPDLTAMPEHVRVRKVSGRLQYDTRRTCNRARFINFKMCYYAFASGIGIFLTKDVYRPFVLK